MDKDKQTKLAKAAADLEAVVTELENDPKATTETKAAGQKLKDQAKAYCAMWGT